MKYLLDHINLIQDPILDKSIKELSLGSYPCVSVNQGDKTIDVFKKMDSHSFSGLAFLDDDGRLVGNISSRDIKAFIKSIDFKLLSSPVGDFIKFLRETVTDINHPTISCFEHTSYRIVLEKLVATKVHRVFVVDGEEFFRPQGVISLQDTISKML